MFSSLHSNYFQSLTIQAFLLPTPSHIPLVFLPAKFGSTDKLERLGLAFMTKPGLPVPEKHGHGDVVLPAERLKKRRRRNTEPSKPPVVGFKKFQAPAQQITETDEVAEG
jgi:hypothetical protein